MAWTKSGTASFTNGLTTVTGSGTNWIANAAAGEAMYAPDGRFYEIESVDSNTSITLARPYSGTSLAGQSYDILPSQSFMRDLAAKVAALLDSYASIASNAGTGKFGDGTIATPGISFVNNTNSGIRRVADGVFRLVSNGVDVAEISPSGVQFLLPASGSFTSLSASETLTAAAGVFTGNVLVGVVGGAPKKIYLDAGYSTFITTPATGHGQPAEIWSGNGATSPVASFSQFGLAVTGALSAAGVYTATTASASNVFVDTDGTLKRSTSMRDLKTGIEDMDPNIAIRLVDRFRAIWYRSLCSGDNAGWSWFGAVAEEVAEIDPRFVHWGYVDDDYETVIVDDDPIEEPITDVVMRPETVIEMRDGVPTQVTLLVEVQVPRVNHVPVVDESGRPVMMINQPEKEAGKIVAETVLATYRQLTHPVPVMRMVPKFHTERRLKSDAVMRPVGLQYERFTVPLMVVARLHGEEIAALKRCVATLGLQFQ